MVCLRLSNPSNVSMGLLFQLPPLCLTGNVDSRVVHRAAPHGVRYTLSIGSAGANYSMRMKSLGHLRIVKTLTKPQEPLALLSVVLQETFSNSLSLFFSIWTPVIIISDIFFCPYFLCWERRAGARWRRRESNLLKISRQSASRGLHQPGICPSTLARGQAVGDMLCQSGQVKQFQFPGVAAVAMAPSWVPLCVNLGASCLEANRENRTFLLLILAPSITQPLLRAPPKALQVDGSQVWGPDAVGFSREETEAQGT